MALFMALGVNSVNWPSLYLNNYTMTSAEHVPGSLNWKTFFCFVLFSGGFYESLVKIGYKKSVPTQFHPHIIDR